MLYENQRACRPPPVSWEKLEIHVAASEKELYPGYSEKPAGSTQHPLEALNQLSDSHLSCCKPLEMVVIVGFKSF